MRKASSSDTLFQESRHDAQVKQLRIPTEHLMRIESEHKQVVQELQIMLRLKEAELVEARKQWQAVEARLHRVEEEQARLLETSAAAAEAAQGKQQHLAHEMQELEHRAHALALELERRPAGDQGQRLVELEAEVQRARQQEHASRQALQELKLALQASQVSLQQQADKLLQVQRSKGQVAEAEGLKTLELKLALLHRTAEKAKKGEAGAQQALTELEEAKHNQDLELARMREETVQLQQRLRGYRAQVKKLEGEVKHLKAAVPAPAAPKAAEPMPMPMPAVPAPPAGVPGTAEESTAAHLAKERWEGEKKAERKVEALKAKLATTVRACGELAYSMRPRTLVAHPRMPFASTYSHSSHITHISQPCRPTSSRGR
jgi:hypothetical protein